ncbi:MAG: CRISPR-associated endonuclease Cas1 [Verrucomicrobiota bacterium]|nr:CRISPR-associated endonuclease Cas1 [Limisphaera sp.]MDW8382875.1 CRISPR-associated endonuclease Cas1 [Verrucomicrobiota bacterium]
MLNEFVYCPRLFYYEWVDGLWADNADTIEGSLKHARVDQAPTPLPNPDRAAQEHETIHARSVTLSSSRHGLIAKIDLVEVENGAVCPVDYKRGAPRPGDGAPEAWDTDRVQLAAQAIILRENGYHCEEGILFYWSTRQRIRLPITDDLIQQTLEALAKARTIATARQIPPPLFNSPKCPRCSLVGICLPDETWITARIQLAESSEPSPAVQLSLFPEAPETAPNNPPLRRLVPARDDEKPLYLNSQGLRVGISGGVLQMREKDELVQEIRLMDINQVNVFGNIQLSTQAIQALCMEGIPISYFSLGGWFYGLTRGHILKNVFLRREQFRLAERDWPCLQIARALISGKIQNQRTLLQRNHIEPPANVLAALKHLAQQARSADSLETLRGIEGMAGHLYFAHFAGMLKTDDLWKQTTKNQTPFTFDFTHRNRRPPRDPVNALLSLAYSLLAKDLTITALAVGFDPYIGFYHQPRFGRPALALDLMEPFRPLIADSAVLIAINNRMLSPTDFIQVGPAVALKPEGRKHFFRAYEQRMDTLATHPLFDYRVSYRRMLEIQTRLLARYLTGEIPQYTPFVTR